MLLLLNTVCRPSRLPCLLLSNAASLTVVKSPPSGELSNRKLPNNWSRGGFWRFSTIWSAMGFAACWETTRINGSTAVIYYWEGYHKFQSDVAPFCLTSTIANKTSLQQTSKYKLCVQSHLGETPTPAQTNGDKEDIIDHTLLLPDVDMCRDSSISFARVCMCIVSKHAH